MIEFKAIQLKDVMPENLLRDGKVAKLAEVLTGELNRLNVYAYKLNYTKNLHELPEEVIDHLLWENHMHRAEEGLLLARSLEDKIRLLESSIELHRHKGTPHAIEGVLKAVGLRGEVVEWFEYDAEPYHFAVELQPTREVSNIDDVRRLVMEYKNTRSWFDGFVIVLDGGDILVFDDSYDYPVFYKTCGEFSGEKEFGQFNVGQLGVVDDGYDYIVEYPVVERMSYQINLDTTKVKSDTYDYIKRYPVTGDMEPLNKRVTTLAGGAVARGELYDFGIHHPVCGEFYAEGDG
ncbi:phage tail protein [Sporosarcina sp. FSL K6-5500]|uniref:phage tail protein n=1 Tax=Sporosarcina sp. FSL K6-5500 TaxID=2921558 RepID=UPI0030F64A4D